MQSIEVFVSIPVMEASWETLLPDLLDLILDRLPIPDYFRFAAVCSSWRRVQRDHRLHLRRRPSSPQLPWIMRPDDMVFYNPSEMRYYQLPLPIAARGKVFRGTSHGWMVFLDENVLLILNPFTGSEIEIPVHRSMFLEVTIYLCSLSSAPSDPNCILLMVDFDRYETYFYCRLSDKKWKTLNMPFDDLSDTTTSICAGEFYIFRRGEKLIVVDPHPDPVTRCYDMTGLPQRMLGPNYFFVESDGEILLVSMTIMHGHIKRFQVFKADLTKMTWVRLESLGESVLYMDFFKCIRFHAVNAGGPGNRICFTSTLDSFEEYDYGSHRAVLSKLPTLRVHEPENSSYDHTHWVLPSLY